ncbi:MAG: multiprotein-bridging factor 1 family protein [Candidatus Micrarchaeota archaeon]|nr:multiprotein-bridging factor 1 family protein [Candidatus Micrarchaeota archaeon]
MGECEMCGAPEAGFFILVEGAKLHVCVSCAKHGKVLSAPAPVPKRRLSVEKEESEVDLTADFGRRIREARGKMKIERKVLAELVNEKESFLERIEAEKTIPTEALALKLERALGIKLFEEIKHEHLPAKKEKRGELTLGDVVVVKRK